jgi:hypothetical protein
MFDLKESIHIRIGRKLNVSPFRNIFLVQSCQNFVLADRKVLSSWLNTKKKYPEHTEAELAYLLWFFQVLDAK